MWVIKDNKNGKVMISVWNKKVLELINTDNYEAIKMTDHFTNLLNNVKNKLKGYTHARK